MSREKEISDDEKRITRYQKFRIIKYKSKKLIKILEKYADNSELLEEFKNSVSDERDHFDFVDLIDSMKKEHRKQIFHIFNSAEPVEKDSPYYYKLLLDIDNTTIENEDIAPAYYVDKDVIPGLAPLILYFSGHGRSTTTFLSARPKQIELVSIRSIEKRFEEDVRYSVLTGSIKPIITFARGKVRHKVSEDESTINRSYQQMADEKYENFLDLLKIYPHCKYIFMGDDTQGDPYIAYKLVNTRNINNKKVCAWTAIRIVTEKRLPRHIRKNDKIIFHRGYYELGYRLVKKGYADHKQVLELFEWDFENNYDEGEYDLDQVAHDMLYFHKLREFVYKAD